MCHASPGVCHQDRVTRIAPTRPNHQARATTTAPPRPRYRDHATATTPPEPLDSRVTRTAPPGSRHHDLGTRTAPPRPRHQGCVTRTASLQPRTHRPQNQRLRHRWPRLNRSRSPPASPSTLSLLTAFMPPRDRSPRYDHRPSHVDIYHRPHYSTKGHHTRTLPTASP